MNTMEQREDGSWVPATPEPWYRLGHLQCGECPKRFFAWRPSRRRAKYRKHYWAEHVAGTSTPTA